MIAPVPHTPILVQLIEANRLVRSGLRLLIESRPGLLVVADDSSIAEALARAAVPHVVVVNADESATPAAVHALRGPARSSRILLITRSAAHAAETAADAVVAQDEAVEKLAMAIELLAQRPLGTV